MVAPCLLAMLMAGILPSGVPAKALQRTENEAMCSDTRVFAPKDEIAPTATTAFFTLSLPDSYVDAEIRGRDGMYTYSGECDDSWWCIVGAQLLMALLVVGVYVFVVVAFFPAIVILSLFENYFWFRRMMLGKSSLRFGIVPCVFFMPPALCFISMYPSRDPPAQKALRRRWKSLRPFEAIVLWIRWGFERRYPIALLDAAGGPGALLDLGTYDASPALGAGNVVAILGRIVNYLPKIFRGN
ncbi:hypothetical protein ACO1O0_005573 [Amphichorda felina]